MFIKHKQISIYLNHQHNSYNVNSNEKNISRNTLSSRNPINIFRHEFYIHLPKRQYIWCLHEMVTNWNCQIKLWIIMFPFKCKSQDSKRVCQDGRTQERRHGSRLERRTVDLLPSAVLVPLQLQHRTRLPEDQVRRSLFLGVSQAQPGLGRNGLEVRRGTRQPRTLRTRPSIFSRASQGSGKVRSQDLALQLLCVPGGRLWEAGACSQLGAHPQPREVRLYRRGDRGNLGLLLAFDWEDPPQLPLARKVPWPFPSRMIKMIHNFRTSLLWK